MQTEQDNQPKKLKTWEEAVNELKTFILKEKKETEKQTEKQIEKN